MILVFCPKIQNFVQGCPAPEDGISSACKNDTAVAQHRSRYSTAYLPKCLEKIEKRLIQPTFLNNLFEIEFSLKKINKQASAQRFLRSIISITVYRRRRTRFTAPFVSKRAREVEKKAANVDF